MNYERGDFKWEGDQIKWIASEKGKWVIHPVLGLMDANSPLRDCIIGSGLAKEIDKSFKEEIKKLK